MRLAPGFVVSVGLLAACQAPRAPEDSDGVRAQRVAAAAAKPAKYGNDDLVTGWYSDQPRLDPATVGGQTFGQLFKAQVTGQVYAQPLVYGGIVLIVTEENYVYGLDAETGEQKWPPFNVGAPFQASDIGCTDLKPSVGITGTPVIDGDGVAYFMAKSYIPGTFGRVQWQLHGVDVTNGTEKLGFPVTVAGSAANDPATTFQPRTQLQRPGLLLLDGVVYAGFGSHCDIGPYQGWLVAITTAGQPRTMWTAMAAGGQSGAAIWQSGSGLMSDGPGRILFATGNGGGLQGPIGGRTPPATLGEAVVRVDVQNDGSLKAADFFAPFNSIQLDRQDADFGSGGPVGLPTPYFGTAAHPHLTVVAGKEGFVYLLDNDNLGGIGNGFGGSDNVVTRVGPQEGVWSKSAIWPGDGGNIYVNGSNASLYAYRYGLDGAGNPTLSVAGKSRDNFGFSSSPPVVTSSGTQSGSALVWIVWSSNGDGTGGQLRAYDPLPGADGKLVQRVAIPIGTANKFTPPGIGDNRVYVGTRDGTVLGFGAPVITVLTVPPVDFGPQVIGTTTTATVAITAQQAATITSITASSPEFTIGVPDRALPAALSPGDTLSVPVRFAPTAIGAVGASLDVHTQTGVAFAALSGRGLSAAPLLVANKAIVSFGGVAAGGTLISSVTLSNAGAQPLTVTAATPPSGPFSASGLPAAGTVVASGASITAALAFSPTEIGRFSSELILSSTGGDVSVMLSGDSQAPGQLVISTLQLDAGEVATGATRTLAFTVRNTGGSIVTITKSKPPIRGSFLASTALDEGAQIAPGVTLTEVVRFAPTSPGAADDSWILTGDDASGLRTVAFTGIGVDGTPALASGRFVANGAAVITGDTAVVTPALNNQTGTVFWPDAYASDGLTISFDVAITDSTRGDGMTLVLADPARGATTKSVGRGGGGLGFTGIPGVALGFDVFKNRLDPSNNFVGLASGGDGDDVAWVVTNTTIADLTAAPHHVTVTVRGGTMTVFMEGVQVLQSAMPVASRVLVGFTGATGGTVQRQAVSNLSITGTPAP